MTIEPLRNVSASAVREFLAAHGHSPEVVAWKYFDSEFSDGRERGLVGLNGDKVVSFLGLIPFTAMLSGKAVDAAWSCDWYSDAQAAGPLGVMLMRQSLSVYPIIYSSGGSDMTRSIMGRLSQATFPENGVELYKPLRVGGAIHLIAKAMKRSRMPSPDLVKNVPLPVSRKRLPGVSCQLIEGVPASIFSMLDTCCMDRYVQVYDRRFLEWQFGRCPAITSHACLVCREGCPVAAVLFWHPLNDPRSWRLCPLAYQQQDPAAEEGMITAIRHIRSKGGYIASLLLSRLDQEMLQVAKRLGFYASPARRPLYILTRNSQFELKELERLTYLDTDYAYRFPPLIS